MLFANEESEAGGSSVKDLPNVRMRLGILETGGAGSQTLALPFPGRSFPPPAASECVDCAITRFAGSCTVFSVRECRPVG